MCAVVVALHGTALHRERETWWCKSTQKGDPSLDAQPRPVDLDLRALSIPAVKWIVDCPVVQSVVYFYRRPAWMRIRCRCRIADVDAGKWTNAA